MNEKIRPFDESDMEEIVQLSLLAWEPVFASFRQILGEKIYAILLYPNWRESQKEGVENICRDTDKNHTMVAECDGRVVGFLSFQLNPEKKRGEVFLLAVHPAYQNDGIGTQLNITALQKMKDAGMEMAVVETGGDDSHAPARRSYEKAGYTALPLVRYFQEL